MKELLAFLEKLSLHPDTVCTADFEKLLESGLSKTEINEAIQICVLFNVIVRISDSLGFEVPPGEDFAKMAGPLLKNGYQL